LKHHVCDVFLPRDAMQARPMPSCGVCPSVRLSICLSRSCSCILSKRINVSCFFRTKVTAIFRRQGPSYQLFSTNSWLSIDDCCSANNNCDGGCAVYRTERHASVSLCLSQPVDHDEEKRTEQNLQL